MYIPLFLHCFLSMKKYKINCIYDTNKGNTGAYQATREVKGFPGGIQKHVGKDV